MKTLPEFFLGLLNLLTHFKRERERERNEILICTHQLSFLSYLLHLCYFCSFFVLFCFNLLLPNLLYNLFRFFRGILMMWKSCIKYDTLNITGWKIHLINCVLRRTGWLVLFFILVNHSVIFLLNILWFSL